MAVTYFVEQYPQIIGININPIIVRNYMILDYQPFLQVIGAGTMTTIYNCSALSTNHSIIEVSLTASVHLVLNTVHCGILASTASAAGLDLGPPVGHRGSSYQIQ